MGVVAEQLSDLFLLLQVIRESGSVNGRTRLQKTVYLLRERHDVPFGFHFKPYFYGPYSDDLADSVENLVALGMIEENHRYLDDDVIEYSYKLTKRGTDFLNANVAEVSKKPSIRDNLFRAVRDLNGMVTPALVATAKSVMASSQRSD